MTARRGFFKTRAGKLVNVEFTVQNGRLADVNVHGDFFLHPDEALTAITKSLDGAPADLSVKELSQRIAAALPEDAQWLGSSPEALAEAVRVGLESDRDDVASGGGERGFS